jgi:hypothetical protein
MAKHKNRRPALRATYRLFSTAGLKVLIKPEYFLNFDSHSEVILVCSLLSGYKSLRDVVRGYVCSDRFVRQQYRGTKPRLFEENVVSLSEFT